MLAACMAFVVFGLWIVGFVGSATKPIKWLGLAQVALFGICGIKVFWDLLDRNEVIVVDSSGIYWRFWSDQTIPWAEVREVRETDTRGSQLLGLWLEHPETYRSTGLLGHFPWMSKRLGFGDISLDNAGTNKSFDQLKKAVLAGWTLSKQS
jgi:hypothetical protein